MQGDITQPRTQKRRKARDLQSQQQQQHSRHDQQVQASDFSSQIPPFDVSARDINKPDPVTCVHAASSNCVSRIPARESRDDIEQHYGAPDLTTVGLPSATQNNQAVLPCGLFTSPECAESVFSVDSNDSDGEIFGARPLVKAASCSQLVSPDAAATTAKCVPVICESSDLSSLECLAVDATFDLCDVKTKVGSIMNVSKQTLLRDRSRNRDFVKVAADTDGGQERLLMRTDDFVFVYDGDTKSYVNWFIIGARYTRNVSQNRLLSKIEHAPEVDVTQYRMFHRYQMDMLILSALVRAYLG